MAFTDRYVKVPIQIYDRREAELTDNPTYEDAFAYLLPSEIDEMFPTVSNNSGEPVTFLYMKSGRNCIVEMHINKFLDLLNNHFAIKD